MGAPGSDHDAATVDLRYRAVSFLYPRILVGALLVPMLIFAVVSDQRISFVSVVLTLNIAFQVAVPLIGYVSARRHPVAVRMGQDGVVWPARGVHVSWSSLAGVRVPVRHGMSRWLPGVLLFDHREADFAARARTRPSGRAIDTYHLEATVDEVLAVISRFAALPVTRS